MFLVRLVYTSKVTESFEPRDVERILESARRQNPEQNVTGLLCFNHVYFLQCLEGSREAVNETYSRIQNDPRHAEILLLDYKEIIEREFDQWSMGYMSEASLTAPLNLRFSGTPEFDPYKMSGESCHQLMLSMRDSVPTI